MMPAMPIADSALEPRGPVAVARFSLGLLLAINLLNYIDRYVLAAVLPLIGPEFRKTDPSINQAKLGLLASAFFLSYMLAAPIFGWIADRTSRWLLVGIGVLLWSGATAASGLAGTFTVLLVSRLFVGVGEAGYGPAAPTILSDLFPISKRGKILAWFYVAIPVGSALGYVIGGKVGAAWGWRWAFYVVTIPGILLGIVSLLMKDPRAARVTADAALPAAPKPGFREYAGLFKNRSYVLNTAAMAAMTFAIGGISVWMPEYLFRVHGMELGAANTKFGAVVVVAGLTATLAGGWLGDKLRTRFGGSYFLVSGAGILIACPFLIAMTHSPFPLGWVFTFLAVFFLFFNTGPSNTALANVVSPGIRASAFALNIFLIHLLGDVLSPVVLGFTQDRYGWNVTFGTVAVLMALAGVLWIWGASGLKADTDAATAAEIAEVRLRM
jgi:MFS family permease